MGSAPLEEPVVCQVWRNNLEESFDAIRLLIDDYPYVAVNAEFPGVVARPIAHQEYYYQTIKCNVDILSLVQLGLSFANGRGEPPPGVSTWQFNFAFSLQKDIHAQDVVDQMTELKGVDFSQAENEGIEAYVFAELLISSGLVMNEDVKWVSYFGSYDLGFLLKMLTGMSLPSRCEVFKEKLLVHFPCLYDIKYILRTCRDPRVSPDWSLATLFEYLGLNTKPTKCQAGALAYATNQAFFLVVAELFNNKLDDSRYSGVVFGIDEQISAPLDPPPPSNPPQPPLPPPSRVRDSTAWGGQEPPIPKQPQPRPYAERLPPGMLRLRPAQMSNFPSRTEQPSLHPD